MENKQRRFWQLDNPNNARIEIDYSEEQPEVKMEYIKTDGVFWLIFHPIFIIWFLINTLIAIFYVLVKEIYNLILNWGDTSSFMPSQINWMQILYYGAIFLYLIGIPMLISYITIKSKKLIKLMPYIQYGMSWVEYQKTFLPEEVKENKIEIPMFNNVGLDYNATGDFSKYLIKFKIVEHDFNMNLRRYAFKKKSRRNEYLWKAVFYFSQQPKNGKLDVTFK